MRIPCPGRRTALALFACLAVSSATGLAGGLVSSSPFPEPTGGRPLSSAEADRLAAMRSTNRRDARMGIRAVLGPSRAETYLTGWVDWNRPLLYLSVAGPGAGARRGLLQAVPGLVATRPHRNEAEPANGLPPTTPPTGGWRLRRVGETPDAVEALSSLIFAMADDQPGSAAALARGQARWLRRDNVGGTPVDVLLGPALTATTARSLAAVGGQASYWLDSAARLRRFETLLPGGRTVRVDLDLTDQPAPNAIDQLGGPPVTPRAVTTAEATLLSRLRQRNRTQGGARITITIPTYPSANLIGGGWVDWHNRIAYLIVRDLDRAGPVQLIRAARDGIAVRKAPPWAAGDSMPPLPPPTGQEWTYTSWGRHDRAPSGSDLNLLVSEVLSAAGRDRDDVAALRASAAWLRTDEVAGTAVNVFELPENADPGTASGQPRARYWVDGSAVLRRIELRTRIGGYAHLDLEPSRVPYVADVPI